MFAELPSGLPPDRGVGHTINTGDSTPVSRPMYRLPKERAEVQRQLAELLEKGFIQPSHSAWGAPVIFVAKKTEDLLAGTTWGLRSLRRFREGDIQAAWNSQVPGV